MRILSGCVLATVLASSACARGPEPVEPPATMAARVGHRLYVENLIADPEVAAEVGRRLIAVDRDGASVDSVLPELNAWLEAWAARNPDRASRARLMPNTLPAARPGGDRGTVAGRGADRR